MIFGAKKSMVIYLDLGKENLFGNRNLCLLIITLADQWSTNLETCKKLLKNRS